MSVTYGIRRFIAYRIKRKEVKSLLFAAQLHSVTSLSPLIDRFPRLNYVCEQHCLAEWRLLVFVASVGTAAYTAQCFQSRDQTGRILLALEFAMIRLGSQHYSLFCDFYSSASNAPEGREPAKVIGDWVYRTLDRITGSEAKIRSLCLNYELARVTGGMIQIGFSNWWNSAMTKEKHLWRL